MRKRIQSELQSSALREIDGDRDLKLRDVKEVQAKGTVRFFAHDASAMASDLRFYVYRIRNVAMHSHQGSRREFEDAVGRAHGLTVMAD
jgi:hypothetical protein